jgi:hypothetical protein
MGHGPLVFLRWRALICPSNEREIDFPEVLYADLVGAYDPTHTPRSACWPAQFLFFFVFFPFFHFCCFCFFIWKFYLKIRNLNIYENVFFPFFLKFICFFG